MKREEVKVWAFSPWQTFAACLLKQTWASWCVHGEDLTEGVIKQATLLVEAACALGFRFLAPSEIMEADAVLSSIPEKFCVDFVQFIPKDAHWLNVKASGQKSHNLGHLTVAVFSP